MRNHSYKNTLLETFCSFPIGQLKGYSLKDALSDLISGLTVAFVRIPQGMAYAFLAGVQPQYGLYTGIDIFSYLDYGLLFKASSVLFDEGVDAVLAVSVPQSPGRFLSMIRTLQLCILRTFCNIKTQLRWVNIDNVNAVW